MMMKIISGKLITKGKHFILFLEFLEFYSIIIKKGTDKDKKNHRKKKLKIVFYHNR